MGAAWEIPCALIHFQMPAGRAVSLIRVYLARLAHKSRLHGGRFLKLRLKNN